MNKITTSLKDHIYTEVVVVISLLYVTRYEKIDHLQKLLNSRYRLTKSGYWVIFFYQLLIPSGIGINNLSSIAVPNFSPLTPL